MPCLCLYLFQLCWYVPSTALDFCAGGQECIQVQHEDACECGQGGGRAAESAPGGLLRLESPGQVHDWRPLGLIPHHIWRYVPVSKLVKKMHATWLLSSTVACSVLIWIAQLLVLIF